MKTLTTLLTLLLTLSSFAGNEGPSAMPQRPDFPVPTALAQIHVSGSFWGPATRPLVVVQTDGRVYAEHLVYEGHGFSAKLVSKEIKEVARLSEDVTRALHKEIAQIKDAKLVPLRDGPGCQDAPSTTYSVFRADKGKLDIGLKENCIDHVLEGGEGSRVLRTLKGIGALADLL